MQWDHPWRPPLTQLAEGDCGFREPAMYCLCVSYWVNFGHISKVQVTNAPSHMSTCAVLVSLSWQLKGYISLMENHHQWILFFHHMVDNLCDKQGPFVIVHIPGLHWVKCFICNAVSADKCMTIWSLIIAYIIVHVISMIFLITEYLFMPTYFKTLFWHDNLC